MREQHPKKKRRAPPKAVLGLPDLDQAKSAFLNSLTSVDAQRGYRHAVDDFVEWYCSEPRPSFNRTLVLRIPDPATTERYLGCKQRIRNAVKDRIGIQPRRRSSSDP